MTAPDAAGVTPFSPEMLELARKALAAIEARKDEDVYVWAKRLAESVAGLND
jgi:hypothetical protein